MGGIYFVQLFKETFNSELRITNSELTYPAAVPPSESMSPAIYF